MAAAVFPCYTTTRKNSCCETTEGVVGGEEPKHTPSPPPSDKTKRSSNIILQFEQCLSGWDVFSFLILRRGKKKVGSSQRFALWDHGDIPQDPNRDGGFFCGEGGLRRVTQWNVPAHGSCTATLFSRCHNPRVCIQGMLGTGFGHSACGNTRRAAKTRCREEEI